MGPKLVVALAMEGKFSTEGLQAVGEDDDLLLAMARELATEKGIGETADLVWGEIQQQNAAFAHALPERAETEHQAPMEAVVLPQEPLSAVVDQLFLFGASLNAASGRKRGSRRPAPTTLPADKQLGLF